MPSTSLVLTAAQGTDFEARVRSRRGRRTAARHTSAEFISFLQTAVETQPRRRELHIIVDNLSPHKTP